MVAGDPHKSQAAPAIVPGRLLSTPPALFGQLATAGLPQPQTGPEEALLDILQRGALDDAALLSRARHAMDWLCALQTAKVVPPFPARPNSPYVLVLDQPEGSASQADMQELLVFAQTETINATAVILPCAEGLLSNTDAGQRLMHAPADSNLWDLLSMATAVYTHSAGAGFEAILAGHRPRVFGQPWYANLGLSEDETPNPHVTRRLTRAQLFAGAMMIFPDWLDRHGAPCEIETVLAHLEACNRARKEDAAGYVASNILRWKRPFLRRYIGARGIGFTDHPQKLRAATVAGRKHVHWGLSPALAQQADLRMEDGFLRSRGLGAALVRPMSLVLDDLGLYFDPSQPSRLEHWIIRRVQMPLHAAERIDQLLRRLTALELTKYNQGKSMPSLPDGPRILVVGQVEDDASIRLAAGPVQTNRALLQAAREAHPEATLIYKPHPDVEAGLRRGRVDDAARIADVVARDADPLALIAACDRLWTMTSLMGFEALLRDTPVTCLGMPFYAGWGLTEDHLPRPARRQGAHPTLAGLAHAALIDYPRYFDPRDGAAISPEEALTLLANAPPGRSPLVQSALVMLRKLRARALGIAR